MDYSVIEFGIKEDVVQDCLQYGYKIVSVYVDSNTLDQNVQAKHLP